MDNFRWILLGVGILIVAIIYFISRKNRRDFYKEDDYSSEDLPEISAKNWDDLDEGVGEVRIIARSNDYEPSKAGEGPVEKRFEPDDDNADFYDEDENDPLFAKWPKHVTQPEAAPATSAATEDVAVAEVEPVVTADQEIGAETAKVEAAQAETTQAETTQAEPAPTDTVLVLNVLARDGTSLSGNSINSVAHANDMIFGEMNIYHRMDANNVPVFSLINMVKPGSFDPATIHDLETPGISLFLQLPGPSDPSGAYDDMLQTAYRMSEMLEARLCDRNRQPLTESVADKYRSIAASFDGKA